MNGKTKQPGSLFSAITASEALDLLRRMAPPGSFRMKTLQNWADANHSLFYELIRRGLCMSTTSNLRDFRCAYCENTDTLEREDIVIAGDSEVKWGHAACILSAALNNSLLPYHAPVKPKSKEGPLPSLRTGGSHCPHCPDVLVEKLELPASAQPMCASVLTEPGFQELLEKTWQDLIKKRFSYYLRTTKSFPMCPVHQSQKVYMTLEDRQVSNTRYARELWLVCPGDQKQ